MKKKSLAACSLLLPLSFLPLFTGCGGNYDYTKHLSEIKSDIFIAETEEFSITLSFTEREYPYADDGIACPRSNLAEISLTATTSADYSVFVTGESEWGGETSYCNVRGDYYYSQGLDVFPEGKVAMRVVWGEETREIVATSVKTEKTISPEEALNFALEHEKETVARMTADDVFGGEFRVRLLRRDETYYYVGIVDKTGRTVSLLLNSETGEVLARRVSG